MSTPAVPAEVQGYLDGLTGPRAESVRAVFDTVRTAMPEGYELVLAWGIPTWVIPLSTYPITYNTEPLAYVALGARKQYNSLYLMGVYSDSAQEAAFHRAWADAGLKLDMGKSCLRFRSLADLDLGIIAKTIAATSVDDFIVTYERSRGQRS